MLNRADLPLQLALLRELFPWAVTGAGLLLLLILIGFWVQESSLRRHIGTIERSYQIPYLLERWQHRSLTFITLLTLIFAGVLYFYYAQVTQLEALLLTQTRSPAIERAAQTGAATGASSPQVELNTDGATPEFNDAISLFDDSGSLLNQLKPQYEELLITAYLLHHCDQIQASQVTLLQQILFKRIMRFQRDPQDQAVIKRFYDNILTGAEGNFQIRYAAVDCVAMTGLEKYRDALDRFIVQSIPATPAQAEPTTAAPMPPASNETIVKPAQDPAPLSEPNLPAAAPADASSAADAVATDDSLPEPVPGDDSPTNAETPDNPTSEINELPTVTLPSPASPTTAP